MELSLLALPLLLHSPDGWPRQEVAVPSPSPKAFNPQWDQAQGCPSWLLKGLCPFSAPATASRLCTVFPTSATQAKGINTPRTSRFLLSPHLLTGRQYWSLSYKQNYGMLRWHKMAPAEVAGKKFKPMDLCKERKDGWPQDQNKFHFLGDHRISFICTVGGLCHAFTVPSRHFWSKERFHSGTAKSDAHPSCPQNCLSPWESPCCPAQVMF